jgi:hypothetical protein
VDHGVASIVDRRKVARADGGEDSGTKGRAFFGSDEFDFVGVNVGLNLPPER